MNFECGRYSYLDSRINMARFLQECPGRVSSGLHGQALQARDDEHSMAVRGRCVPSVVLRQDRLPYCRRWCMYFFDALPFILALSNPEIITDATAAKDWVDAQSCSDDSC